MGKVKSTTTAQVSVGDVCELAASVAHQLNEVLRAHFGQGPGLKQSASVTGTHIQEALKDGVLPLDPKASWERWKKVRKAQGWTFDPTYDKEKKTHPNLVIDYNSLPERERLKDYTFWAAVNGVILGVKRLTGVKDDKQSS